MIFEETLKVIETLTPLGWHVIVLFGLWRFGKTVFDALASAISRGFKLAHGDTQIEVPPQTLEPAVTTSPAQLEQVEVAQEAVGFGIPTVTQGPPPHPPAQDPPELQAISKAQLAAGMVHWHAMFLSAFLQPHTIGVLAWLEANGSTTKSDLLTVWRPTIPEVQELERVLTALESNQLIEVKNGVATATTKARNFLAWRVQNNFYPTKLDTFQLAPRPTR